MAGRKKDFNASPPIQVGTVCAAADGNPFVIDVDAGLEGMRQFSFERWLGRGIDPWVQVLVQQLRVFLQGEIISKRTVAAYARSGVMVFLEFLVSTGATYAPSEVTRHRIEQFLEWLKIHSTPNALSQNTRYCSVKSVLKGLARRGLIPRDPTLFPTGQFLGCRRNGRSAEPLSQAERARLAEALRKDIIALHHRAAEFCDSEALAVYALALCLRTGLNTTPMLELRRDALTRHPFLPRMGLLTSFKRRNHRTHWMTLVGEPIRKTAAVPVDAVALFNKLLERTRPLAESAPEKLRNVLWLYRSAARGRSGRLHRFGIRALGRRVPEFVRRHHLCADDGTPLRLNNKRLRVTMENRLWKLSNGDLFTVASLMGHDPKVVDQHYLAVTAEMRAHATIVGEALPDIYRGGSINPLPQPETTPVGGCKDSLYGEKAPKDGVNHCMDFLSCFRCRSYAVVGSKKDLHRLFSFYWFLAAERKRIPSRAWREHLGYLMSLIDAFTLDKFDNTLVKDAKTQARAEPLPFWKNYQMAPAGMAADAD
jgi:hypothetical protein